MTAERKYEILQEDHAALLNDIQSQLEFAKAESATAGEIYNLRMQRVGNAVEQKEAELQMQRAKLAVERLQALFDRYRKAGGWKADPTINRDYYKDETTPKPTKE